MKTLAKIGILSPGLVALVTSYALNAMKIDWWQSFLQNLGAGLLSALVLIWLYDQVL
jgi:hypothetical protein